MNSAKTLKIKTQRPETIEFIDHYLKLKGIAFTNNTQLAAELGYRTNSSITEIIKGRQNIDPDKLLIFKEKYRKFIPEPGVGISRSSNGFAIGEIQDNDTDSPFIDLGTGQFIMIVPLVQDYAYAGYLSGYQDKEYIDELPKHSFVVNKQHKGKYMAFQVIGDSMSDGTDESITEGSTVTGREIQRHLWSSRFHIHRFKDYVIVHKEGILIKRIIKHDVDTGVITCQSLNPNKDAYPDFELALDDCSQIFNIVNVTQIR
ncbi:S24 family peptidase [Mucilaginibacter sp. HMF5004]|uniref:S24 family peptidase n=1 Tax=Mucilaginibacter rivuli TaxID=2857527 RepID=UPI001C601923|nr:S24 family peptidase [Mucilaginibacter rivuli]MBW4889845.1 S24 family peptidase [Mucilaginibacter rivuli]